MGIDWGEYIIISGVNMPKYITAPYLRTGIKKNKIYIGFGSIQAEFNVEIGKKILTILNKLKHPTEISVIQKLLEELLQDDTETFKAISNYIFSKHWLIEESIYNKEERYSRQKLFYNIYSNNPDIIHQKLSQKHIAIIGCGGIGNIISVNLATSGIKELTLIDQDLIEESNLSRQIMFRENDVNSNKAEALKNSLLERNSKVKINTHPYNIKSVSELNILKNVDFIVISGDSKNLVYDVNKYSYKNNIPFINVGYIMDIAVWGPIFVPSQTPCFACFSEQNISKYNTHDKNLAQMIINVNSRSQAPSIGPINMLAGAYASLDIIKYLGGIDTPECMNHRIGIWTNNLKVEYQENIEGNCSICSKNTLK